MRPILDDCKDSMVNLGSKVLSIRGKSNDRASNWGFRVPACSWLRQGAGGGQMGVGTEGWWSKVVASELGGDAERRGVCG